MAGTNQKGRTALEAFRHLRFCSRLLRLWDGGFNNGKGGWLVANIPQPYSIFQLWTMDVSSVHILAIRKGWH